MLHINNDQNKDLLEQDEKVTVADPAPDLSWESLASVEQSRQNELISEVYRLGNRIDDTGEIESIKEEWESASSDTFDSQLEEKFKRALEVYEERQEKMRKAKEVKENLVKEAQELQESTKWAQTSKRLQAMQREWKDAGFAGEDDDQVLWDTFSEANDIFFNRQNEFFDKREELQEEAAERKEALIAEAEKHKDSSEWKETSAIMRDLMEAWKEAGFASREVEDALWERFNAARQHFYDRQNKHFDEMRARHAEARAIKEELIEKAEVLANEEPFSGDRRPMDELFQQWKDAGSSGRAHEQELWNRFKAHQDKFFQRYKDFRREYSEERRMAVEEEIRRLEVRINALEEITEMINIKLTSFSEMDELSEEQENEREELKTNLKTNEERLSEYHRSLNSLRDELNQLI